MIATSAPYISKKPPLDWIRGFSVEEIGQRENESQFEGPDADYPVDWEAAKEDARQQWVALTGEDA